MHSASAGVIASTEKSKWIPCRRAQPLVPCPRNLSGFCPSSACGADTALLLSGSAVVISPAPVPVVPDWAIALLVLVSILLLLSIFTCLLMMVRPHPLLSPRLHSAGWCPAPVPTSAKL